MHITKTQAEDIQDALDNHMTNVVNTKKLHYDAIQAIADDTIMTAEEKKIALDAYDINSGWSI